MPFSDLMVYGVTYVSSNLSNRPLILRLVGILVLIEGAVTIALGLAGFFLLPGPAEKTKFLNERERMIAIERLNINEDDGSAAVSNK